MYLAKKVLAREAHAISPPSGPPRTTGCLFFPRHFMYGPPSAGDRMLSLLLTACSTVDVWTSSIRIAPWEEGSCPCHVGYDSRQAIMSVMFSTYRKLFKRVLLYDINNDRNVHHVFISVS